MAIEKISYIVRYIRQGKTNQWKAKTPIEQGIKTNITEVAHGSFTAQWKEQTKEDQKSEEIFVLVERDAQIAMLEKANQIADKEFLKRHPGSKIEHRES